MEQRTCNIIMTCKGNCGYAAMADTLVDAVKIYLGKECDYPWEKYSERMIESILLEALYDFMNTATRPGYELRQLFISILLIILRFLSVFVPCFSLLR